MASNSQEESSQDVCRVLLCVDGSKHAESAFRYYKQILHKPQYEILLIHVSDVAYVPSMHLMAEGLAINEDEIKAKVALIKQKNTEIENKYKKMCDNAGFTYRVETVSGDEGIGRTIADTIKKRNISVAVLGSRGLGTIRRTLLGSVSEYVLHHTDIPVFICPVKAAPN